MSSKKQPTLRNAAEPFRTAFDNSDYTLTETALKVAVEPGLYRKRRFDCPKLKFLSFEAGTIRYLNYFGNDQFELTIILAADHLEVSCSCAEQVKTICVHSFRVLEGMSYNTQQHYLNQFKPGGIYKLYQDNPDCFDVEHKDLGQRISVRKEVGNVFSLTRKIKSFDCVALMKMADMAKSTSLQEGQVCFFIMGSERYRGRLAYLLPCIGIPTKDCSSIKSFHHFEMAGRWIPSFDLSKRKLTEAQKQLCGIGKKLFADNAPDYHSLFDQDLQELSNYFDLWKSATKHNHSFIYTRSTLISLLENSPIRWML